MFYIKFFIYFLVAINIVTFVVYGIDKWIAICNGKVESSHYRRPLSRNSKGRRIPETTLLLLAVIGGSVGAWMGMTVWHHKTKHLKFKYGVPAILIIQLVLLIYVYINVL